MLDELLVGSAWLKDHMHRRCTPWLPTMRGDSVRYLGVRFDNGADGSGCRLEPPEEPQVVPRRGTRALKGHRHAPRGNPTCCQAPARSALDARSEFFTGVDPVTGGSCRWADWTTGPTRVHHARGAVEFDVREGRRHRCAGSNPAEGTNPYSIRTCTCWSPAPDPPSASPCEGPAGGVPEAVGDPRSCGAYQHP